MESLARPSVESVLSVVAICSPRPTPVASRIAMLRSALPDALLRAAMYTGKSIAPEKIAGTRSVITMNQRDRTRSVYSRFATTNILARLPMAGHPCFDAGGADALEENLVQR